MSHIESKLIVIIWISPLCQLQQCLVEWLCQWDIIPNPEHYSLRYQWIGWYAAALCVEMTILSIAIRWRAFPAKDLFLWDRFDAMMRGRANSEVSINVGVEVDSETYFSELLT